MTKKPFTSLASARRQAECETVLSLPLTASVPADGFTVCSGNSPFTLEAYVI
jgi:hypothetical protein